MSDPVKPGTQAHAEVASLVSDTSQTRIGSTDDAHGPDLPTSDVEVFETEKVFQPDNDVEFEESTLSQERVEHNRYKLTLETRELEFRLRARKTTSIFFFLFLFLQNAVVYSLVVAAFVWGQHHLSEKALSILVTGTLAETYLIVRIIVKWIFEKNNYSFR